MQRPIQSSNPSLQEQQMHVRLLSFLLPVLCQLQQQQQQEISVEAAIRKCKPSGECTAGHGAMLLPLPMLLLLLLLLLLSPCYCWSVSFLKSL